MIENEFIFGTPSQGTYVLSSWIFLRLLGLVYGCAFISLWTQIKGLCGNKGILPWKERFEANPNFLPSRFKKWCSHDCFLNGLCAAGTLFSFLLILGIVPPLFLFLLWLLYLLLSKICGVFLQYQWDVLLLEIGFLAIFLTPLELLTQWRLARPLPPSFDGCFTGRCSG